MAVSGNTHMYDGFIRILWGDKGKTICLTAMGTDADKAISLDDCLNIIGYDGDGTVFVIFDNAMHGEMYCYGNYGKFWTEYGTTQGYA